MAIGIRLFLPVSDYPVNIRSRAECKYIKTSRHITSPLDERSDVGVLHTLQQFVK